MRLSRIIIAIVLVSSSCLSFGYAQQLDRSNKPGLQVTVLDLDSARGLGVFLYEAVRSGQFAEIEVVSKIRQQRADGSITQQRGFYQLKAVSDVEACWGGVSPDFGRFGNFGRTVSSAPVLFQPPSFDREFVKGRCVIGYPIEHLSAAVSLELEGFTNIRLKPTSAAEEILFSGKASDLWEFFTLERPDLRDPVLRFGISTTPDEVTDQELIRAIEYGGKPLSSALKVITKRVSIDRPTVRGQNKQELLKRVTPTGDSVVQALLNSEAMINPVTRLDAIWAFIAIGPNSFNEAIVAQLINALELPVTDNVGAGEVAWRARVERSLSVDLFDKRNGRPAHEDHVHLSAAAELAITLSSISRDEFASHFEASIRASLLDLLVVDPHVIRIAATSAYRDDLLQELLEKSDHDKRTPPPIQARIEMLLTEGVPPSPELAQIIRSRCAQPNSLVPNGDRPRSLEFCRVQGYL